MKQKNANIFWASFADLMTVLFIVTLVLFVLSYKLFREQEIAYQEQAEELKMRNMRLAEQEELANRIGNNLQMEKSKVDSLLLMLESDRGRLLVLEQQYRKLKEIERSVEKLDTAYFEYQPKYKRHVLKAQVQFETGQAYIPPKYHTMLKNAGQALKDLIAGIDSLENIKYTLIIEGQASRDDYRRNYELSYERALALKELWERQGLEFSPKKFEILIAGSGTGGVGRVDADERKNQRFLIQIIPKVGTIDLPQVDLKRFEEENKKLLEQADEA